MRLSVGPTTLFDKSALESLNPDESLWFDNFYNPVITPLFYVETLADLYKEECRNRTPEQIVGHLAIKTPEMSATVCVDHWNLRDANLQGCRIEMGRRPHVRGARRFDVGGQEGAYFEQPDELLAFKRWQEGDFLGVERDFAKRWRQSLSELDLTVAYPIVRQLNGGRTRLSGLAEALEIAERMVSGNGARFATLKALFQLLSVPTELRSPILKLWKDASGPRLQEFAPYAAYMLKVDFFFYLALDAGLLSSERVSNRVDMAYLYYLPFCQVFTSGDKLHRAVAPHFLGDDQLFLWAPDFKADLKALNDHFSALPDDVKAQGISKFAKSPPMEGNYLTTRIWDKFSPNWRKPYTPPSEKMREKVGGLMQALSDSKSFKSKLREAGPSSVKSLEELDHLVVQRVIHARRGNWQIIPPETGSE